MPFTDFELSINNLSATFHNKLLESTQYCTILQILDRKHMDELGHDVIRLRRNFLGAKLVSIERYTRENSISSITAFCRTQ